MTKQAGEDGWWRFLSLCAELDTPELLNRFLQLSLTIEERASIAGRMNIIVALLQGECSQRQMAENLGVSIAKITRGSNSLKQIDESLRELLLTKLN